MNTLPIYSSDLPLEGVRILDLTWLLPGPFATLLLADLGADVVKVERPGTGDYLRDMLPDMFEHVNRGKRSVAIDLKDSESLSVLLRLVSSAHVVIEGFRPGVADRLGIGYDALTAIRPDIIYLSISGYGQTGPYSDRAGHDINYLAMAGALSVPASWNEPPHRSGLPVSDLASAMYAALNIVAAVRRRDQCGKGIRIDLAIADAALHWTQVRTAGINNDAPNWHHVHPANDVFETSEGRWVSIALVEAKFFRNFCIAANRPDLLERYGDIEHISFDSGAATALKLELATLFRTRSLPEWTQVLVESDIPFAPVNLIADVMRNPHFAERHAPGQTLTSIPGGLGRRGGLHPAPQLGQHLDEILADWANEK
jgi:crotonobetainyl-CoA:carnitine CoA-transferase CaiB-like acyl-CoA transferase